MLTIHLSKDLAKRLEFWANRLGRTAESIALEGLGRKIEDLEVELMLERALAEDDGTRIPLNEVMKHLDAEEAA
jgi:predicted DNA-binding protein